MVDDISTPLPTKPVRLVDRFRFFMRALNMSYRTEKAYVHWILRYIRFHDRKHPDTIGAAELEAFLSHLAVNLNSSINTQRTALNALMFFIINFQKETLKELRQCERLSIVVYRWYFLTMKLQG